MQHTFLPDSSVFPGTGCRSRGASSAFLMPRTQPIRLSLRPGGCPGDLPGDTVIVSYRTFPFEADAGLRCFLRLEPRLTLRLLHLHRANVAVRALGSGDTALVRGERQTVCVETVCGIYGSNVRLSKKTPSML